MGNTVPGRYAQARFIAVATWHYGAAIILSFALGNENAGIGRLAGGGKEESGLTQSNHLL